MSTRSHPPTSAPQARARKAYDDNPAPPIPTNHSRLPASGRKRDQLLRDLLRRVRPGQPEHRLSHRREPRRVGEQLLHERRHAVELLLRARGSRRRRARSSARSASGGRRSRAGRGRGSPASRRRRAPRRCRPRARPRGRAPPARPRTRPSRRRARSRRAAPARASARSRARPRRGGRPGRTPRMSPRRSRSGCARRRGRRRRRAQAPRRATRSGGAPPPEGRRGARADGPPGDAVLAAVAPVDGVREEDPAGNGAASRFASPRCASASVSAAGTFSRHAA